MASATFEFPDGHREVVGAPGRRYTELLAAGHTPLVGPVLPIPDPFPQYTTGGEVATAVADQIVGWPTWPEARADHSTLPPALLDRPTIKWYAGLDTTMTNPAVFAPSVVGTGTQVVGWDGQDDPVFRFGMGDFKTFNGANADLSLIGDIKPGGGAQYARWPLSFEFITDADNDTVEVGVFGAGTGDAAVLVEVNGAPVDDVLSYRDGSISGSPCRVVLTFPNARSRRIRILAGGTFGLVEVRVPTGQTLTKPGPVTRRVAMVGDSWVNGAGSSSSPTDPGAGLLETFAPRLGRMMGAEDTVLAGIGTTGYSAGGAESSYISRMDMVETFAPDAVVVYGSQNDSGVDGSVLRTKADELIARALTITPEVYVIGCGLAGTGAEATVPPVRDAADAAGVPFVDITGLIKGPGNQLDRGPSGLVAGNGSLFRLSDNNHPSLAGHRMLAREIFRRMMAQA